MRLTSMRRILPLSVVCIALFVAPAYSQPFPQMKVNAISPLPPVTPTWLEGYQVRWPVRVIGLASHQAAKTVLVSLPTGGWLKPDGSDLAVQGPSGNKLPFVIHSHDPLGETIIQFQREGDENWYWVYGVNAKAPALVQADPKKEVAFHEGTTLEVREWDKESITSWPVVRAGLDKAKIVANGMVAEPIQKFNPARPDVPKNFAASYRGYLTVEKEGTYRFVLNADGASFLFIDGFKVVDRPGENRTFPTTMKVSEIEKIAGKVDLKPGVHAYEIHQAVGEQASNGVMALLWSPAGEKKFGYMPQKNLVQPLYARVADTEFAPKTEGAFFVYGMDDTLEVSGLKLFLVRLEAHGNVKDPAKLVWDMGDGTQRTGRSLTHCYFRESDHNIALQGGTLPAFKQRFRVWPEPGEVSPLSLEAAVDTIAAMEWHKLDVGRIREIFAFLQVCEQPNRWALLEKVAQFLLQQKDIELELRSQLYTARMESLMHQGKAVEALKLGAQATTEFSKTAPLLVRLQLATAAIQQYHFKDFGAASKIYKAIIEQNNRVEHPNLRLAGIRWGDLFAEQGDIVRAGETYRIAATLGGEKFAGSSGNEATTRGALMRIAEQKLKSGEVLQTRQLLERMELEFPGRRLDGVYCFLRAESDRLTGRYEEALRNYEMIFRLPQWAGYKDRASFGMADTYLRLGDLPKAKEWFAVLRESFPKFYDTNKGKEIDKLIDSRMDRIKSQGKGALFDELTMTFEPSETEWWGDMSKVSVVRAPGIAGPHSILVDPLHDIKLYDCERPVKSLVPGGLYWAEVWYQDVIRIPPQAPHQIPTVEFVFTSLTTPPQAAQTPAANVYLNVHHRWHKAGGKVRVPLDQDFFFRFRFGNMVGAYHFDRVSLRPISDRHMDALTNFLEGKAP